MLPVAILAGGLATRLGELTKTLPKALIEIHGEPFLAHQLRLLSRSGIRKIVLCVGYRCDQIRDFAGDGRRFNLDVEYSFDGAELLGTAGAIRQALSRLGPAFFVIYGDSYLPCDYAAVERQFSLSGSLGLMTVFHNAGDGDASNVEFSEGRILEYDKVHPTPRMRHIDYGLGVFHDRVFRELTGSGPLDLAGVYRDLLRRGQLASYQAAERFHEIGSQGGIAEFSEFLARSGSSAASPQGRALSL
jgi:N-acetyl-alpha-D-muramate 1-phosphate uridylyltransferase